MDERMKEILAEVTLELIAMDDSEFENLLSESRESEFTKILNKAVKSKYFDDIDGFGRYYQEKNDNFEITKKGLKDIPGWMGIFNSCSSGSPLVQEGVCPQAIAA